LNFLVISNGGKGLSIRMSPKIYLTTTLPYVNADPHIGFAFEVVTADTIARYHRLLGHEVFFNTGTDEHGQKIFQLAVEAGMGNDYQKYVDLAHEKFRQLLPELGVIHSEDGLNLNFIRTTDKNHAGAVWEFWKRVEKNGFIYKKLYKIKYCVGCELEKTDSELKNGRCSLHPNKEIEIREEENYFFKFSAFQDKLLKLYADQPDFVLPNSRFNEIKAFVERGLEDFSISRLVEKMPWGFLVPGDQKHAIYVWFDALINYISAIGWPEDEANFHKWWPVIQFAGKDNLRQQAAMWQAMLMSAHLPPSKQIHGFIVSGGQKMSKSLGNVINPLELVEEYGTDAVRYFLVRHVEPFEDTDVTLEKFKEIYNANLANGLGNLVSRVMKMATVNNIKFEETEVKRVAETEEFKNYHQEQIKSFDNFEIQKAIEVIWREIGIADKLIQLEQPFKKIKTEQTKAEKDIKNLLARLWFIAVTLKPFMPQTAQTIIDLVTNNQMPDNPIFPRK